MCYAFQVMIVAVIPAFNESKRIAAVVKDARAFADHVLVVDDGSEDGTGDVAREAGARVVHHLINSGPGAATMTGIEAARALGATIVITLDADGQHDPRDIPLLLQPILDGKADIVFANRFGQRNHIPLVRRIFNSVGNGLTFAATGRWVPDSQCGFKVFGPKALREVDLRMMGFEFCTEIVREAVQHRWRMAQIPTKVLYSEYTMAKGQSFANGIKTALKILLRSFLR
jgi:glycosyltransferase involved in cell wall biosynthesis